MTRFAIDAPAIIRFVEEGVVLHPEHSLVAPGALRSQVLDTLYRDVRSGRRSREEALELQRRVVTTRIRLLADRVSQDTAWRIAEQLGWDGIGDAEYLAVARLQADALVASSASLREAARGVVETAAFERLAAAPDETTRS